MNRVHPTPGREPMVRSASTSDRRAHRGPRRRSAWVALGALALGMVLGASAETLYRRALAVVETAYGSEDPRIAGPLANLARLYRTSERWDDAATLSLRLAGVFERVLGADDFHVAMTLDHVAEAYAAQGRYAEAEHFYGRVVAILAPRLGSDHSLVQEVLAKQARARHDLELSGARKG